MKKTILFLAVSFMLVTAVNSFSEPLQIKMNTFEVGAEGSYINYEEPGVMEQTGFMVGVTGSYAYHNNAMFKVEGKYSAGLVDYENSGTMDNIPDYMLEFRALGGFDIPISDASYLTPYIGFGYRYLNDDMSGKTTSTGAGGYERESNYYYSPVGIEMILRLKNDWYFGVNFEYDYFWMGEQVSHLEDVSSSYSTLRNDQDEGYGLRGSMRLQKEGRFSYAIEPFVRYWNISKSDDSDISYGGNVIGYGWEPKNNSTEIGLKFLVRF